MERVGQESFILPLLKLANCQKGPLGQSISANFVADCSLYLNSEYVYSPERFSTKCSTEITFSAERRMFIGNIICLGHN